METYSSPHDRERRPRLGFILPDFLHPMWPYCDRDALEHGGLSANWSCGCPECLAELGMTVIYVPVDLDDGKHPNACRLRVIPIARIRAFDMRRYVHPEYRDWYDRGDPPFTGVE